MHMCKEEQNFDVIYNKSKIVESLNFDKSRPIIIACPYFPHAVGDLETKYMSSYLGSKGRSHRRGR